MGGPIRKNDGDGVLLLFLVVIIFIMLITGFGSF